MARKEQTPERKVYVTIRSGRKKVTLDTRSYWQIVGEVQFIGEIRISATDAAKWCLRAKPGDTMTLPNGTTLEVHE